MLKRKIDYPSIVLFNSNFIYSIKNLRGISWHIQVAVILIGHIAGVYISHIIAQNVFKTHKYAILTQVPMLILMIAYTIIGLWILSQSLSGGL